MVDFVINTEKATDVSHDETIFLAFRIVCGLFGVGLIALSVAGFISLLKLNKD